MIPVQSNPQSTVDPERVKRAKKNRELQLCRWEAYEKSIGSKDRHVNQMIFFQKDIMLLEAVSRNDLIEVENMLKKGFNPNASNVDGLTGLHQCCIDDYVDMAQLLLNYKADPNKPDSENWTPLHAAATCGRSEIVTILAQYKVNFLAINAEGNMPYDICDGEACLATIEMEMSNRGITQEEIDHARSVPETKMLNDAKDLIKSGQNHLLERLDSQGANMLHISSSLGFSEVVRYLLENHVDTSIPDAEGWQSIHIAACWNHLDIVEMLVGFGADIDAKTTIGGENVFDLSEPESHSKLLHIKNNAENIRRDFHPRKTSEYRSFRKNRGSSIRRTSMKQKNQMARKEAKEEFLTMNATVMQIPTTPTPTNDQSNTVSSPVKMNIKLNRQTDQNEQNSNQSHSAKSNANQLNSVKSKSNQLNSDKPNPNQSKSIKPNHNQSNSSKPNVTLSNSAKADSIQPKLTETRKNAYIIESLDDKADEDSDCDMIMTDEIIVTISNDRDNNEKYKKEYSKSINIKNNNINDKNNNIMNNNNKINSNNDGKLNSKSIATDTVKEVKSPDTFIRNSSSKRKSNQINHAQNSEKPKNIQINDRPFDNERPTVYSSNVENWDPSSIEKKYSKRRRHKGCCKIL